MFQTNFNRFVRWLGEDMKVSPNQVTLGRFLLFIPGWFIWAYRNNLETWTGIPWKAYGSLAFFLVTMAIIFDIVDGALARAMRQESREGKILDPAADKFITYSTLVLFWDAIDRSAYLILLVLDLASTFLRGAQAVGANDFGKKKALFQNLSKFFFGSAVLLDLNQFNVIGNLLIWGSIILAAISVVIRIIPAKAKHPLYILIPQIFTAGNLLCGIAAMALAGFGKQFTYGILLTFGAMGCDVLDGAVARRLGVTSNFGKYFDTVADMVSFGVTPAVLVIIKSGYTPASILCGLFYIASTAYRLYDYGRSKDRTPSGFFRGFPSPAGAWLVMTAIICIPFPAALVLVVITAVLMCTFKVYWQHFSRILPSLTISELFMGIILGLIPAFFITPLGFLAGPILIYLFSPRWRNPRSIGMGESGT